MQVMQLLAQKLFHEVVDVPILLAWLSVCNKQHHKQTLKAITEHQHVHPEYEYHI